MSRVDKVLELIDGGLQSSSERGYVSVAVDRCPRCVSREPCDGSEFCGPCRAFLLGDGPDTSFPAADARFSELSAAWDETRRVLQEPVDELAARFATFGEAAAGMGATLRAAVERIAEALGEYIDPETDDLMVDRLADYLARDDSRHDELIHFAVATAPLAALHGEAAWTWLADLVLVCVTERTGVMPRWCSVRTVSDPVADRNGLCVVVASWSSADPAFSQRVRS